MPKIGVTSLLRNATDVIIITSLFRYAYDFIINTSLLLRPDEKLTFLSKTKPPDSEPFIEGLGLGALFLE